MCAVRFIQGRWVNLGVPLESMGSSGVVALTCVRPWGRWVNLGVLLESMGSSGVVTFTRVLPGSRWVHPGLLGSLARVLGFIDRLVGVTRARPGCHWVLQRAFASLARALGVDPGSFASLACALGVIVFIRCHWVHLHTPPRGRCVHLGSLSSFTRPKGVIRGRWVQLRASWGSLCSSFVVGFTRACPGGRWVHPESLGSLVRAFGFDGFIQCRCVDMGVPLGSMGSSWVSPGVFSGRLFL